MSTNSPRPHVDQQRSGRHHRELERMLATVLRDRIWVNGWQPDELLRQIRRAGVATEAEVLAMAITADTAHHERVGNTIHESWRRQTERIARRLHDEPGGDGWLARWLETVEGDVGRNAVRALLDRLLSLPRLPTLIAPPGSTGGVRLPADDDTGPSPTLTTIRRLLAKAEATEFPAEAEMFTAKAQEMMTRARLDEATVRASGDRRSTAAVSATRVAIDEPYVGSKRSLLHVVAEANEVRCVFHRGVDLATLVGPVGQLAHVELLFTSLLIQVQSALAVVAADAPAGEHVRSRRFRSSFIVGFAVRIGQRLHDARDASFAGATADALPVLAADAEATAQLFDRLIGGTTRIRSSASHDARGVHEGAKAADRASLRESGLGTHRPEGLPAGEEPGGGRR